MTVEQVLKEIGALQRKAEAEIRVGSAREFHRGQKAACVILSDLLRRAEKK